jgi:hypothetical protein
MDGFSNSQGNYNLAVSCPTGHAVNPIQGTLTCTGAGSTQTGSTVGGVSSSGSIAPEHYYAFTSTSTQVYTFSSCGSQFDTFMTIYTRVAGSGTTSGFLGAVVTTCDDCGESVCARVRVCACHCVSVWRTLLPMTRAHHGHTRAESVAAGCAGVGPLLSMARGHVVRINLCILTI